MKFSPANAKTYALAKVKELQVFLAGNRKIFSFDLLSGHSCPSAKLCHSKAVENLDGTRRIMDGKYTEFRCFSASQEAQYSNVYNSRKENMKILEIAGKSTNKACEALKAIIPKNAGIVRIHVAGDFKTKNYFQSWLKLAESRPDILFYAYTKQLKLWVDDKDSVDKLSNLVLTASYGGWSDNLISDYNLRSAKVVFSTVEAKKLGLPLDKTDEFAANPKKKNNSFALLLHGTQPPKTEASKAWQKIKTSTGGYSR